MVKKNNITNTWLEHSNGISTYGNRRQSVPSGNSSYEKRKLVLVNGKWVTLELEWSINNAYLWQKKVHLQLSHTASCTTKESETF